MKNNPKIKLIVLVALVFIFKATGQESREKIVNENAQVWTAHNSTFRISERWAIQHEIHLRRTDFLAEPNSYLLRIAAKYYMKSNLSVSGGYVHRWLTKQGNWDVYQNERRAYQELSASQPYERLNARFRLRTEQRFFNIIANGNSLNDDFMVHRVRLLLGIRLPFKKEGKTQFMVADEIHLNFGKNVILNAFNQNRLIVGIKQKLNDLWSFDLGYMMVYQQSSAGNVYNLGHTLRLFFYGNFDLRKHKRSTS